MNKKSRKKSFSLLKKISYKEFKGSLLRYVITVFSCVIIIVMGTGMLAYATTSIGENIITNILTATGLTVNGNATTTGDQIVSGNLNVSGNTVLATTTLATTTISALSSINETIKYVKAGQTIQEALDLITDASSSKPYTLIVPGGHDTEQFNKKSHVNVIQHRDEALKVMGNLYAMYRQNPPEQIISSFETEDEWTKESGNGTLSLETSDVMHKDGALKITNAGQYSECIISKTGSWDFSKHHFSLWLNYTQNINHMNDMRIYFYTDTEEKHTFDLESKTYADINNLWQNIVIGRSMVTEGTGNIDWSNITKIEIRFTAAPGWGIDVILDSFKAIETFPFPLIGFRSDDGYATNWTQMRPILDKYGYKGITAVVTGAIGNSGKMTSTEIQQLDELGWDMCSHTHTHPNLGDLTDAEVRYELLRSKRELENLGIRKGSRFIVYPLGSSDVVTNTVKEEVNKLYLAGFAFNQNGAAAWNDKSPYMQGAVYYYYNSNIEAMKSAIDNVVQYNGVLWLTFHDMKSAASGLRCTPAEFEEIVDYVHSKNAFVVTYSDVYDNLIQGSHPSVSGFEENLVTEKTANATLSPVEQGLINCDASSTPFTLTLPASSENLGLTYTIKKIDSSTNAITIDGNASETIDGETTNIEMDAQYDTLTIECDGSNWHITEKKISASSGDTAITSGNTFVDVIHGYYTTPATSTISILPLGDLGNASTTGFWISDIGASTFRINVGIDPGKDVDFAWNIGNY